PRRREPVQRCLPRGHGRRRRRGRARRGGLRRHDVHVRCRRHRNDDGRGARGERGRQRRGHRGGRSRGRRNAVIIRWRILLRIGPALLGGLLGWTVLQVLLVRFVPPAATLTMFTRACEHAWHGQGFVWPARSARSIETIGPNVARAVLA